MKTMHFACGALVCLFSVACGSADGTNTETPKGSDPSISNSESEHRSTTAASARTQADTGIGNWEVVVGDGTYRAIGRGEGGRTIVEFRAADAEACNRNNGKLIPTESKESPSGRLVTVGCVANTEATAVDAGTQLMWKRLAVDTGPMKGEERAFSASPTPWCPTQTNFMCCGHVTMWCEDQWTNANFECETSGWYICGGCWHWLPTCTDL